MATTTTTAFSSSPPAPSRSTATTTTTTTTTFTALRRLSDLSHRTAYERGAHGTSSTSTGTGTGTGTHDEAAYDTLLAAAATELRRHIIDAELAITSLQSQSQSQSQSPRHPSPSHAPAPAPAPAHAHARTDASTSTRIRRLRAETAAHRSAFSDPAYMPLPTSPLNQLLAYRATSATIANSARSLPRVEARLAAFTAQLDAARALLREQAVLRDALETRLRALEKHAREHGSGNGNEGGEEGGREEGGREEGGREGRAGGGGEGGGSGGGEVRGMRDTARLFERRTARALKELNRFIDKTLEPQLEVEEVGGPVAGLAEELKGRGRARGQRRIDEMFRRRDDAGGEAGAAGEGEGGGGGGGGGGGRGGRAGGNGGGGVGADLKTLLEELMNASERSGQYVVLARDSAAARFLVRAGVARLHPRDARRLRLVEFGARFDGEREEG